MTTTPQPAHPPQYWLIKSEPDAFSFQQLQALPYEPWSGVRNYQARNFLRQMQLGDLVFFYHSSCAQPGIVGIAEVVQTAYPDNLQFDPHSPYYDPKASPEAPRWSMVNVRAVRPLTVSLNRLRQEVVLANMPLLRKGNRLSVLPVLADEWQYICSLAEN